LFSVQTHPWLEDPSNYIGLSNLLTMTLALAYLKEDRQTEVAYFNRSTEDYRQSSYYED